MAITLWRTVLAAGLADAARAATPADAAWLQTPDFAEVCDLAGLDPDAVRTAFHTDPARFTQSHGRRARARAA